MAVTARRRPVWMERPSIPTQLLKTTVLLAIVVVMVLPFVYVVAVSFSSAADVLAGGLVLLPAHPTGAAYESILRGGIVARALLVSTGITVAGTALSMGLTTTMAYGLTRTRDVPGSRLALLLVLGTLLFSAGIIPNYLLVKSLHLLDTYWAVILPGAVSAFNLVVVRQFFMAIPYELIESARLDGANDLQILVRVVLPLSKAVLAVIALFYAVGYWNDFFNALLYLNDASMWPVQLVLRQYVLQGTPLGDVQLNPLLGQPPPPQSFQMAVVVLGTLPILLVYPLLQRYFTKGVLTGAIKG
ncbi:MAG TPA: carbohydrate ABC transporter permease [Candidatus Dormibacteraeota bacterium]|nr:carbohydrate ABC transporter permease [Candidatus Dormibacteraeota bacterium]